MSVSKYIINMPVDLLALHRSNPERYPYLLQSVAHDDSRSRYSILFAFPQESITCETIEDASDFLTALNDSWQANCTEQMPGATLPFSGGWFVYMGYETLKGIEPTVVCHEYAHTYPVAFATRCPAAIIIDHAKKQTCVISESEYDGTIDSIKNDIDKLKPLTSPSTSATLSLSEANADEYLQGVMRILEYIKAGDVFQVNLSRHWHGTLNEEVPSWLIYQSLCQSNPAPFACLIHHQQGDIISSSPERLVESRNGWVQTRPIAGTRPRTGDDQDIKRLEELRTDLKEHAEHIMLIDLERNDLGRLCQPGSITVNELMALESYAHVHHIVSNIKGKLRLNTSPVDVIKAVFPGGTITGCPKVRCMEIIAELEHQGRGPYTGSAGYINHDGSMDLNILIRTLFKQGKQIDFRAGAGIVSDSIPERELNETRHKAKGLILAFELAE